LKEKLSKSEPEFYITVMGHKHVKTEHLRPRAQKKIVSKLKSFEKDYEQCDFEVLFIPDIIIIPKNIELKRITILYSDEMVKNMIINPVIAIALRGINNFFMLNLPNF